MKITNEDIMILAKTIYGEARGELSNFGLAALIAVANVVLNRAKKRFAPSVRDVCLAPYQFSCWNRGDPNYFKLKELDENNRIFKICLDVAKNVLNEAWPDLTDGCDHYHRKSMQPFWAVYIEPKRSFGNHLFYNLKENQNDGK